MSNESSSVDPVDGFDLGQYRNAVAKYVKLMIRARAKTEPGFLGAEQYERWNLDDIKSDRYTVEQLLRMADAAHDHLWRNFIGPHGSGGVSEDDPRAELKQTVVRFTMGTPHAELLNQLKRGEEIDWPSAAEWELLDTIREGLDKLSEAGTSSRCPVVIVDSRANEVKVRDKPCKLREAQMNVIQAMVEAYPYSLTEEELIDKSGHSDARGILTRLRNGDEIWATTIQMADVPGGGYSLTWPENG